MDQSQEKLEKIDFQKCKICGGIGKHVCVIKKTIDKVIQYPIYQKDKGRCFSINSENG